MTTTAVQTPTIRSRTLSRTGKHTIAGDLLAAEIVDCARRVMLESGAGGYSVRKVAKAAGVSIGHLQHYFATGLELQLAILDSVGTQFYAFYTARIAPIEDPVERLVASAKYVLAREDDQGHVEVMREFWVLASRDKQIAAYVTGFYSRCASFIARSLRDANPNLDKLAAERRSRAAVALLSGSFLYLDPTLNGDAPAHFSDDLLQIIRELPFTEFGLPRQ